MTNPVSRPAKRPRIVFFSGGTACRNINLSLCRGQADLTRIVPSWDSGGSSKVIRDKFGILSVGDIRQALMTMAHGEGRAGDIVKICNARLSSTLGKADARAEFDYYAEGRHPLLHRLEPGLRGTILSYLSLFRSHIGDDFDLRNGSIGNFILTGAYLAHGNDINTAIFVFRKLCSIQGNVWPASTDNQVLLSARLSDGREIVGQHLVTSLDDDGAAAGIAGIRLSAGDSEAGRPVAANDAVIEAIADADAIIFGPGSFYSSILPHLLVEGITEAISNNRNAARILIGNILECSETRSTDLAKLVGTFLDHWKPRSARQAVILTHVLSNRELFPFDKTVGAFRYLRNGDLEQICQNAGISVISGEFEDAWHRGQHDGDAIAEILLGLV